VSQFENSLLIANQNTAKPIDCLALWDSEGAGASVDSLTVVRLDASESLLIPFTTSSARVKLHYTDYPACRGYLRCLGGDCLLCRAGKTAEERDLLPVYDPVAKSVKVLPISPNLRPAALRPQIAPILRELKAGKEAAVLAIRRPEVGKYEVHSFPLPEDGDDGATAIKAFQSQFEAGKVDLAAAYEARSNEELAQIPEVAASMRLRNIRLS
jgi:hypothetical protein